jgi:hypothetical protein
MNRIEIYNKIGNNERRIFETTANDAAARVAGAAHGCQCYESIY